MVTEIGLASEIGLAGAIVMFAVRVILKLWEPGDRRRKKPGQIGLPTGGLASPAAVHAVLTGRRRPKRR